MIKEKRERERDKFHTNKHSLKQPWSPQLKKTLDRSYGLSLNNNQTLLDRVDVKRNQTRGSAFRVRFKPSINPLLHTPPTPSILPSNTQVGNHQRPRSSHSLHFGSLTLLKPPLYKPLHPSQALKNSNPKQ